MPAPALGLQARTRAEQEFQDAIRNTGRANVQVRACATHAQRLYALSAALPAGGTVGHALTHAHPCAACVLLLRSFSVLHSCSACHCRGLISLCVTVIVAALAGQLMQGRARLMYELG